MIGRLRGVVSEIQSDEVIVDVGGVGYRLTVPLHSQMVSTGETVVFYVFTHVREDAILLYGFETRSQLALFEQLISVSGIGPKLAMAVLSHMSPDAFASAVIADESAPLTQVPGIGKKTAARILLELKDRMAATWTRSEDGQDTPMPDATGGIVGDALAALLALGFSEVEAREALGRAEKDLGEEPSIKALTRGALKYLDRGSS